MDVATFLVEHYWPGVTPETFQLAAEQVRAMVDELAQAGTPIRFLHSTLMAGEESAFCVFEADSRSVVEDVYERANVNFERINDALEIEP